MATPPGLDSMREQLTSFLTTSSNYLTALNKDYSRYVPSLASVNFYSEILIRAIFIFKVTDSVRYIYRRKRATRGPGALVPLIQFWVCHSLLTTLSRIFPYWAFIKLLTILPLLSTDSVLSLYEVTCQHLFNPAEPEAESALRHLRERYSKFRQWGILVIDELVKLYTVGGMKAVIAAFRQEQPIVNPRAPTRLVAERDINVNRNIPSLRHDAYFDDDGAEVLSKVRRSVVVNAKPEEPKPAYSDSRKLRESFRRRAAAARKENSSQHQ